MSAKAFRFGWVCFFSTMAGCSSNDKAEAFDYAQLLGIWTSVDTVSSQVEEWEQVDDTCFVGRGYVLEDGDTTFFESLEIRKEAGIWTYFAKVQQLNGLEVVPFQLNKQTPRMVEFVNVQHDFPKKIGYQFLASDELQAYIEGPRNGQNIRIMFDFRRK